MPAVVVCLEILAVSALLCSIYLRKARAEVISKTAASLVFLSYGFLQVFPLSTFGLWIFLGLVAAFAGDLFLLRKDAFIPGLGAFLLCHLAYIFAFSRVMPMSSIRMEIALPILVADVAVLLWLWPHCSRLRAPVVLYVLVISLMTMWAISAFDAGRLSLPGALGAVLFFLSDLFVARHRFVRRQLINRFLGLPLYYASQLLIASLITSTL